MSRIGLCPLLIVALAASHVVADDHWPQFRGPGGLSNATDQSIPDEFGPRKNLAWRVEVPAGHSSPVVWGDRIFLTAAEKERLLILCYSAASGKELWRKAIRPRGSESFLHVACNAAQPTPCCDGKRVYCSFGAFGLIAFELDGNLAWQLPLDVPKTSFGTGSSPIVDGDRLFVLRDEVGKGSLNCYRTSDGKQLWSAPRGFSRSSFSTPFLWKHDNSTEVVAAGTFMLQSFNPDNGDEKWHSVGITSFVCPTPTSDENRLYFAAWSTLHAESTEELIASAFDEGTVSLDELSDPEKLFARLDANGDGVLESKELPNGRAKDAFKYLDRNHDGVLGPREWFSSKFQKPLGKNLGLAVRRGGEGDVTKTHVEWTQTKGLPYVASPVLHDGRLYLIKKGGIVSVLDPPTGQPKSRPMRVGAGGEYYASPIVVGNGIILASAGGVVTRLAHGGEPRVVFQVDLGEPVFATPAVVQKSLIVRSSGHLWRFSDPQ